MLPAPEPTARCASAINARVPPSPLLSARSRITTYFSVTTTISAHRINDTTPSTACGDHSFAERVKRAGADVAINDANAADQESLEPGSGMSIAMPISRHGLRG